MKKIFRYIVCAALLGSSLIGCDKEEGITPSDITNLKAEAGPGKIILRWETPDDGTIRYIKVSYFDQLLKKNVVRLASAYSDSILIPETRKKYGAYSFTVQVFSDTDTGGRIQTIDAVSDAAPITTSESSEQVPLTAADLSTNAQEPSEGPIANLLDGNKKTYFHTVWSGTVPPAPHWMQIKLNKQLSKYYKFYYAPRENGNNKPVDFDLMGSTDGTNWFLIRNFTKEADDLPVTSSGEYTSPAFEITQPFTYIRFSVNKTNNGSIFWTMSEFKIFDITKTIVDPEAPDAED